MTDSPPESVDEIHEGSVLAGKYRVLRIIGTGGMGTVVAAHHIQLDERVALKFLLPSSIGNLEAVARFMREARTAFKIKSEHVARVTDVGQLENGSPYIVMEYLEGMDLADWLTTHGAMAIPQAVDFILQASEAIAEAHALGIVHRDLKPANLFCIQGSDGQPSIKVLDFGISKVLNESAQMHAMTRTNGLVGSPLYMSPEHMKSSKSVDARTDIWSLGVILFQLVSGHPPFESEQVTELVLKVATEPATPLRTILPEAPEGLERVLMTCLEKDRERRYQTIGDLAQALLEFGSPESRASVDRIVRTLEMGGTTKAVSTLARSGTNPSMAAIPHPVMPHTLASWNEPATSEAASPARARLAADGATVAITLATATILSFFVYYNLRPRPSAEPGTAASASASAATGPTPASPPPPAPAPPGPPPATSEAQPPPTSSGPTPSPSVAPAAPPAPPLPLPARPLVRHCNPPYTVDAHGTRHYKPECPL